MRFAVIHSGMVENLIEAQPGFSVPGSDLVEASDDVGIGWSFDGKSFSAPGPLTDEIRFVSPWDFRLLFTKAERIAIYGSGDGIVRDFLGALQTITTQVDLQDEQTAQGVGYLSVIGLIDSSRVSQILSGQPPE